MGCSITKDRPIELLCKISTAGMRNYAIILCKEEDVRDKGRPTDNIAIERFFRSYKWERLYLIRPETIKEVKEMTIEYMHRYNNGRIHQSLDGSTPAAKYNAQMANVA